MRLQPGIRDTAVVDHHRDLGSVAVSETGAVETLEAVGSVQVATAAAQNHSSAEEETGEAGVGDGLHLLPEVAPRQERGEVCAGRRHSDGLVEAVRCWVVLAVMTSVEAAADVWNATIPMHRSSGPPICGTYIHGSVAVDSERDVRNQFKGLFVIPVLVRRACSRHSQQLADNSRCCFDSTYAGSASGLKFLL